MGSDWDDMLAADAMAIGADSAGPSEPVTYTAGSGEQYEFSAVINRASPTPVSQASQGKAGPIYAEHTTIFLPLDSDGLKGIPCAPVKNEKIEFATNIGGEAEDHSIVAVLTQDAGGFLVAVR